MAKLLIATCALFLFSAIAAKPLHTKNHEPAMKEIIGKLQNLEKTTGNTAFVPQLSTASEKKNLTIEEIACRGVESLKHLSNPEKEQVGSLNHSLAVLSHGVNCTVNSETSLDLNTFIITLRKMFQERFLTKRSA